MVFRVESETCIYCFWRMLSILLALIFFFLLYLAISGLFILFQIIPFRFNCSYYVIVIWYFKRDEIFMNMQFIYWDISSHECDFIWWLVSYVVFCLVRGISRGFLGNWILAVASRANLCDNLWVLEIWTIASIESWWTFDGI